MAKRSGPFIAVAGLALCAALAWIALSPIDTPTETTDRARAPAVERPTAAGSAIEATEAPQDAPRALEVVPPTDAGRIRVTNSPPFDTDGAIWVEGRVIFPPDTPPDERAEVVAYYSRDESEKPHRASVAADGAFRVAFPAGTDVGRLELSARYVFLSERLRLTFADPVRPLVLEPELGGSVHAVFVLPAGSDGRQSELVGTKLSADADVIVYSSDGATRPTRSTEIEDPTYADIGGLIPGVALQLSGEPRTFAPFKVRGVRVQPGAVTTLEVRLDNGISLSGRVVDELERPLSGVKFQIEVFNGNETTRAERKTPTGPDGRFTLQGVRTGRVTLTATALGYVATRVRLDVPPEGDAQDDLHVVMKRGRSIQGRVQWPDGSPAAGATVVIALVESDDVDVQWGALGWSEAPEHVADGNGAFEIRGLTAGPFALIARAPTTKDASKTGSARTDSVSSGGAPLVVTLDEGYELRGRVVDETGHAFERFTVAAVPVHTEREWQGVNESVTGRRLGEDSRFVVEGLRAGTWKITARVGGAFARREVSVPGNTPELEIVLARPASISGVVLDPDGQAVRGARVSYTPGNALAKDEEMRVTSKPTGADGRFALEAVSPGPAMLDASHFRWAPSETERVDLPAGATVSNFVAQLRATGRLTGEVRDADGRADSARRIYAHGGRNARNVSAYAETDADGRFEFDALPAGEYELQTLASTVEREAARGADGRNDWTALQNKTKRAPATVVAGQTTHVVLGDKPRAPVRVNGRVTCRDHAVGGMSVAAHPFARTSGSRSSKSTRTRDDGHYELVLDEPGQYTFMLGDGMRGATCWRSEMVPEQAQMSLDFELPSGRISGRVIAPDGEPASAIPVELESMSLSEGAGGGLRPGFGNTTTGDDGRFAFDYLLPGTYSVHTATEERAEYGRASANELVLSENAAIEDVELKLQLAAGLEVEVVGPGGERIAGADVLTFDEAGSWIEDSSRIATDAAGRKRIGGLPARPSVMFARKGSLVSAMSAPVSLRAGETRQLKLEMRPGTMLYVVVESPDTIGPRPAIVRDERGIDHSALWWSSSAAGPPDSKGRRGFSVGPLPPGRYRVTPKDKDLEKYAADVVVAGEEVREIKLTP